MKISSAHFPAVIIQMADIFLSYSRKDKAIMQQLNKRLLEYGFTVWTDEGITPGTQNWMRSIEKALQKARVVVILLSPDAYDSEWVRREISLGRTYGCELFPLLVRGIPSEVTPFDLVNVQFIDISDPDRLDRGLSQLVSEFQKRDWESARSSTSPVAKRTVSKVDSTIPAPTSNNKNMIWWLSGGFVFISCLVVGVWFLGSIWGGNTPEKPSPSPTDLLSGDIVSPIANLSSPTYTFTPVDSDADLDTLPTLTIFPSITSSPTITLTLTSTSPPRPSVLKTIAVSRNPKVLIWNGKSLWVGHDAGKNVVQIENDQIVNTVELGDFVGDLAWDGNGLWVAAVQIDVVKRLFNGEFIQTIPVGEVPVALAWDGNGLWVANGADGNVMRIVNNNVTQKISVPGWPTSLIWDGNNLWVASSVSNDVYQIVGGQIVNLIPSCSLPSDMVWDGQYLWVACSDNDFILQISNGDVIDSITVGQGPAALIWDGESLWVSNSKDNTVMRIVNREILDTINVGNDPRALAWDGEYIWVANYGDNTIMKIGR